MSRDELKQFERERALDRAGMSSMRENRAKRYREIDDGCEHTPGTVYEEIEEDVLTTNGLEPEDEYERRTR